MNVVIVHPERCVGCMQCMVACATAHSRGQNLLAALLEEPKPRSRIHVGAGIFTEGFPNRCRHCDPAPCMMACLPGAIYRHAESGTVLIDPDLCINCASCAMACPFGVLRFHEDYLAVAGKLVAVKCDNCLGRQSLGKIPACVETCITGALTFEEPNQALKRKTDEVARTVSRKAEPADSPPAPGFDLMNTHKRALKGLEGRS